MNDLRTLLRCGTAALALAWLPSTFAQQCNQPGLPALAYAAEAASHPLDDGIGTGKRVHAYGFTSSQTFKICSIGYEAPPTPPTSYVFKLYDCSSGVPVAIPGATLSAPASSFTGGGLQYVPVVPHWGIVAGHCYQIHRIAPLASTPAQREGRRLLNETTYPITGGAPLTILSTTFFNSVGGTQIADQALPLIDLGWY